MVYLCEMICDLCYKLFFGSDDCGGICYECQDSETEVEERDKEETVDV